MNRRFQHARQQAGFSLLEMVFVVAILTIVMGVVFTQIDLVQKRSRTEEKKVDLTQESREFMDQVVRDMHSIGYPTPKMFIAGSTTSSSTVAAGLVKAAYDELWFEGDIDGDGNVDVIDYTLQPGANGNCPCTIARSQVQKAPDVPMNQNHTNYFTGLTDVVNSGGAGGGGSNTAKYTISGSSALGANDTVYATYKTANLFTYYDSLGNEVPPADLSTQQGQNAIAKISSIRININVLASRADLQTNMKPVMSYSAAVRLPNQ
jgi:prepilin-type N-terminal cleavage/methylation domain-containing protein